VAFIVDTATIGTTSVVSALGLSGIIGIDV
jgi:hypothetical protein